MKRARIHISFKLLKVLYFSPDTCRSRYLGLCTLLCALCRPSVMLCILAYMACERGYTHVHTHTHKLAMEVTVQYSALTQTSEHDLWRHNENGHSL